MSNKHLETPVIINVYAALRKRKGASIVTLRHDLKKIIYDITSDIGASARPGFPQEGVRYSHINGEIDRLREVLSQSETNTNLYLVLGNHDTVANGNWEDPQFQAYLMDHLANNFRSDYPGFMFIKNVPRSMSKVLLERDMSCHG